jgi:glycosyltransferase involved in cell wall biosynthesis
VASVTRPSPDTTASSSSTFDGVAPGPAPEGQPTPRTTTISFVIPAYNEADSIEVSLKELLGVVDEIEADAQVIVVDDGSTDGTTSIVRSLRRSDPRVRVLRLRRNQGKSHALQVGLRAATGATVFLMDADGQDDPAEIPRMLDALDGGLDLVTGRRKHRQDRFVKRTTSKLYNWTTRKLTGVDGHDFNCGFKAMRAEVARSLDLYGDLHRYIPVLGAWAGFRVGEIEVNHRPRFGGESKFGGARFWRGYLDLLTVKFLTTYTNRPLHFLGSLGTALGAIGGVILAWLSVEWLFGTGIGTRPLLTAGVLLVIVGVQLISLGLVAELVVSLSRRNGSGQRYADAVVDDDDDVVLD